MATRRSSAGRHSFALQLKAFAQKTSDLTNRVVSEAVLEIGTRIVERSPVGDGSLWKHPPPPGYIGGRFRGSWMYGNDAGAGIPSDPNAGVIDPTGGASIDRIISGLPAKATGVKHVLINNLPYAQALEDGWSKQAPSGMVGLVALEAPQIIREIVENVKGGK